MVFEFDKCFDGDLHEVGEALMDELTVVDDLVHVVYKDFFGLNKLVGVRIRKTSIVLVAASEQLADGGGEGHRQHQVVSTSKLRVGEGPRQLSAKTRRIVRL